jgi:hypothetical protein
MHAVLCALPLALGVGFAVTLRAQPGELPAIFAPKGVPNEPPRRSPLAARETATPISQRSRLLMNEATIRVLEAAPVSHTPIAAGNVYLDSATGTMVMAPVVVRSQALRESQVRPPTPRLYHFTELSADKFRRIAGGATVPLYHAFIGGKELQVDFNVLNLGGKGIDHNIDFSRVEIAFTFKW